MRGGGQGREQKSSAEDGQEERDPSEPRRWSVPGRPWPTDAVERSALKRSGCTQRPARLPDRKEAGPRSDGRRRFGPGGRLLPFLRSPTHWATWCAHPTPRFWCVPRTAWRKPRSTGPPAGRGAPPTDTIRTPPSTRAGAVPTGGFEGRPNERSSRLKTGRAPEALSREKRARARSSSRPTPLPVRVEVVVVVDVDVAGVPAGGAAPKLMYNTPGPPPPSPERQRTIPCGTLSSC